MVWARLDDGILDNPKIERAGALGFALHVAAIAWCARNLTDGRVPASRVTRLLDWSGVTVENYDPWGPTNDGKGKPGHGEQASAIEIANHLVDVGLWELAEDGDYLIHDYLEYNPSRAEVLGERERGKVRAAKSRHSNNSGRSGEPQANGRRTRTEASPNVQPSCGNVRPVPNPFPEEIQPEGVEPSLLEPAPTDEPEAPPREQSPEAERAASSETARASHAMHQRIRELWAEAWAAKHRNRYVWSIDAKGPEVMALIQLERAAEEEPHPEAYVRHVFRCYLREGGRLGEEHHPLKWLPDRLNAYGRPKRGRTENVTPPAHTREPDAPAPNAVELGEAALAMLRPGKRMTADDTPRRAAGGEP